VVCARLICRVCVHHALIEFTPNSVGKNTDATTSNTQAPHTAPDLQGTVPLHYAASGGRGAVVAALLAAGADPDPAQTKAGAGLTPLFCAVKNGCVCRTARFSIHNRANIFYLHSSLPPETGSLSVATPLQACVWFALGGNATSSVRVVRSRWQLQFKRACARFSGAFRVLFSAALPVCYNHHHNSRF
jgi:hypothetical protein